jgi:replicative DNA helicase
MSLYANFGTDAEAERVLLGTMLDCPEYNLPTIIDAGLVPEDFHDRRHAEIFAAAAEMFNEGKGIDAMTLSMKLQERGSHGKVGGEPYLRELETSAATRRHVADYARRVLDKSLIRKLYGGCVKGAEKCRENQPATSIISDVQAVLLEAGERLPEGAPVLPPEGVDIFDNERARVKAMEGSLPGVPTGFFQLDNLINGLHATDLIVLGGRPGMGKTAFLLNLAINAAIPERREGCRDMPPVPVLLFSLEMGNVQIINRIICQLSGLDVQKVASGCDFHGEDALRLTYARETYRKSPIAIIDSTRMTPSMLMAKAKGINPYFEKCGHPPLGMIMIDYLQLLKPESVGRNREREVAQMSASLKFLAKDMNLPVVCCSQLKRSDEGAPELSDLRESGAIEQDADVVGFILRREMLKDGGGNGGLAELQIKKHRNGPTGTVFMKFDKPSSSFRPASYQDLQDAAKEARA